MKLETIVAPALVLAAFFAVWELFCWVADVSYTLLPPPSAIFVAIIEYREILFMHASQTLLEAILGLVWAICLGGGGAVLLFSMPRARAGIYPLLVLSQTIPIIALAPLLLIWFGFDLVPKVTIVVLYCFFPIAIATFDALSSTDENAVDFLKSMRASRYQALLFVYVPSALPAFFSGLRIAVTYAIAGAIVGEFVGAYKGLGIFMLTSANSHAIVLVFAALFVTVFLTLGLLAIVFLLERMLMPWKRV